MARCVHFDVCYPVCLRKHISKAEVIHREALIGRNNALGRNRQLKLLLLYLDVESLPLQEAFCFHGIEVNLLRSQGAQQQLLHTSADISFRPQ